jgi:hypothetical protein
MYFIAISSTHERPGGMPGLCGDVRMRRISTAQQKNSYPVERIPIGCLSRALHSASLAVLLTPGLFQTQSLEQSRLKAHRR